MRLMFCVIVVFIIVLCCLKCFLNFVFDISNNFLIFLKVDLSVFGLL